MAIHSSGMETKKYAIKKGMTLYIHVVKEGDRIYSIRNENAYENPFKCSFMGPWDNLVAKNYAWLRDLHFQGGYGKIAEREFLAKIGVII